MPQVFRSLVAKLFGRKGFCKVSQLPADSGPSLEELEARRLPAADITGLWAAFGESGTLGTTSHEPVVSGTVAGDPIVGVELEYDLDGDSIADGSVTLEQGLGEFTVDLREIDSSLADFEGDLTVRARAIQLDGSGSPTPAGDWVSTDFFVFGPPPTLSDFGGTEGAGDEWTFSGVAGGPHAAGATIEFGGVLEGYSVQADENGNFSLTVQLGDVNGTATAKVVDSLGQESETLEFFCDSLDDPVLVDFSGTEGAGDEWTFSGSAGGPTAAGATIEFGGVLEGHSVQADEYGNFSLAVHLDDVNGTATAKVVDSLGRESETVEFFCDSLDDPVLVDFSGYEQEPGVWTFSGMVSGPTVEDATIEFGGALAGTYAQADSTGCFQVTIELGYIEGSVMAWAVDGDGRVSNSVEVYCCSQTPPAQPWEFAWFEGSEGEDDSWTFTGTVMGENLEGAVVTFGGVLSGYTAQLDASGSFAISASLFDVDGYAYAEMLDPTGEVRYAEVYCCSQPDPIAPWEWSTFGGWEDTEDHWIFTGTVIGENVDGATVSLGGVLSGYSAQLDSNGSFTISVQLTDIDGYATAEVTDPNGETHCAETYCCSQPAVDELVITSFSGSPQEGLEGTWWFEGSVTGTYAPGANVAFGGVLSGCSAQVDTNGTFFLSVNLGNVSGQATAVAEGGGQQSNTAEFYLV